MTHKIGKYEVGQAVMWDTSYRDVTDDIFYGQPGSTTDVGTIMSIRMVGPTFRYWISFGISGIWKAPEHELYETKEMQRERKLKELGI